MYATQQHDTSHSFIILRLVPLTSEALTLLESADRLWGAERPSEGVIAVTDNRRPATGKGRRTYVIYNT